MQHIFASLLVRLRARRFLFVFRVGGLTALVCTGQELGEIPASVGLLRETMIGKAVGPLRKTSDAQIARCRKTQPAPLLTALPSKMTLKTAVGCVDTLIVTLLSSVGRMLRVLRAGLARAFVRRAMSSYFAPHADGIHFQGECLPMCWKPFGVAILFFLSLSADIIRRWKEAARNNGPEQQKCSAATAAASSSTPSKAGGSAGVSEDKQRAVEEGFNCRTWNSLYKVLSR